MVTRLELTDELRLLGDSRVLLGKYRLCLEERLRHQLTTCELIGLVAARLADSRDDLVGDPALERLRLWLAAAEHQRIEARLVDTVDRLAIAGTLN